MTVTRAQRSENGSALVIALLVTVILAMLGISFLLMAETENRIARNERRAAQAFYAAQSTASVVKRWFDFPASALAVPGAAVVDRSQRRVIDERDPYDPADVTDADGLIGSYPYYKQGVDLDANSADDLFDRPYREGFLHQFLGTEDGPDIVIDETDPAAATFLRTLEQTILPGFPGDNLALRIARIDLFAPPYARGRSGWERYGVATVRVVARLLNVATQRVVAEREVRAVISEVPYWGTYGPLHSCADLTLTGSPMTVHWGAVTSVKTMRLPAAVLDLPRSIPRELPVAPRSDPLLASIDWNDWGAEVAGQAAGDPWLRFIAGGDVVAPALPNNPQPYASPWAGWNVPDPAPGPCCDVLTHLFQRQPLVGCPIFAYDDWKAVAGSGERAVHYFAWTGSGYAEDGVGATSTSIQSLTHGREGIFFFDTVDGLSPRDDDGDGVFDNLVGLDVRITGAWDFRGVLYLNVRSFGLDGATGVRRGVQAPGEPYLDADQDGAFDGGEVHLNLAYPATAGTIFEPPNIVAGGGRDERGPLINLPVSMHGLLVNQGTFEATGSGTLYGSVVAVGGVTQSVADGSLPTPRLVFDGSMVRDGFPAPGSSLPRVTVTGWVTQRQ